MHFYGTLHLPVARWQQPAQRAPDEALPEIVPGTFAARAHAERSREALQVAAGNTCVLQDGRSGRVVEIVDGGHSVLVRQPG